VVRQARESWREHQVITAPDGWPLWTSDVRPGREHDTTALREHSEILPALNICIAENLPALGDLGYEGESGTITVAFKKPKGGELTEEQKDHNKTHNGKRAVGERGNALLKTTFKALRNVSICPWRIGTIVAAALVILHSISVWRSVRASADTKTKRSRHTLAMPVRCVVAPRLHRIRQAKAKKLAGSRWQERGLVFASAVAPRWTRTTSAAASAAAAGEAAAHHLDRFDRKPYLFIP
jgi:DDE superfamily endonuclease